MDISKLQGAQSFTVTKLDKAPGAEELKALEKNGKVEMIVQDGEQTVLISGEAIDINEYNTKMGEAIPTYKMGPYNNADLKPLEVMDLQGNKDGKITEAETRYTLAEAGSKGLDRMGETVSGVSQIGGLYGMVPGVRAGSAMGTAAGYYAGSFLGGVVGFVASPFTGGWAAAKTVGTQKNVETWGFTNHLKDLR